MRAGRLYWQITVQGFTNTVNAYGTPEMAWATKATVRSESIQRRTSEFIRGQGAQDEALAVFRIRYLPDVTNADRVLFEGRTFNITEIVPIDRRRGLELRCTLISGDPNG